MEPERVTSFQKSDSEGTFKCTQCGQLLNLKQGQLIPPCPRCGWREFERTEGVAC